MPIGKSIQGTTTSVRRGIFSKSFGKLIGFFFMFIFLIIPLIYAIILSIQAQSIQPGVQYLGERFLDPLLVLNKASLQIVQNHAAFIRTGFFFKDIWHFIVLYWNFLGSLYIIYRWIKLLSWLYGRSPFSNESQKFINSSLATLTFFALTFLYLSLIAGPTLHMSVQDSWKIPIDTFKNFFKAFPYMIKSANGIVNSSINKLPNINITNATSFT